MRQLYDIITKETIDIPYRGLVELCKKLNINYTNVSGLEKGLSTHLNSRYILPTQTGNIFTFINFETKEEYDCICYSTLEHYFNQKLTSNEIKYLHSLKFGNHQLASICGRLLMVKGAEKIKRFMPMKNNGEKLKQMINEQRIRNKISSRLRCRISSALKRAKTKKKNSTTELIGCSCEFLMGYLEKQFVSGMTWQNYGEWHIDHIMPLASFDLTSIEQQHKSCHYTNLQPLWATDNFIKHDKLPIDAPISLSPNNVS